jgi:hypothetical protein
VRRRIAAIELAPGVVDVAPQLATLFGTQTAGRSKLRRTRRIPWRFGSRLPRGATLELGRRRLHTAMPHLRMSRRKCSQGGDCS